MPRSLVVAMTAFVLSVLVLLAGDAIDDDSPTRPPAEGVVIGPATPSGSGAPGSTDTPGGPSTSDAGCVPAVALVDPEATPEAECLAARLDQWQAGGEYGLGQQINASNAQYAAPLLGFEPDHPAVVGFDLAELAAGQGYRFQPSPLDALLQLNSEGVVLSASWHAADPATGGSADDRSFSDLAALLSPGTHAYRAFWRDVDEKLSLIEQLGTGDDGAYPPAAVLFRPFHEANGDWFWWAQGTDPRAFTQLYAAIQERAWQRGIHNIVWGFTPNAVTGSNIADPLTILPEHVDVVGVDSYQQVGPARQQSSGDHLDLTGLAELAARVPRYVVSEAGPHGSRRGDWDPTLPIRSAVTDGLSPAYVLFWFDDGDGSDGYSGKKQLTSLTGGPALLLSCPGGVCRVPG